MVRDALARVNATQSDNGGFKRRETQRTQRAADFADHGQRHPLRLLARFLYAVQKGAKLASPPADPEPSKDKPSKK
jgi:hypothetical protein